MDRKPEFIDAKIVIRNEVLVKSLSKIDLWTSPNGYAMCGIAAHLLVIKVEFKV